MRLAFLSFLALALGCTAPDVAPAVDVAAPVAAQPDVTVVGSAADARVDAKATPDAKAIANATPTAEPDATPPVPIGATFHHTREHDGLRWVVQAHLERSPSGLELVADIELHNIGDDPAAISSPPKYTVQGTSIPGRTMEGFSGLSMRGQGWGSVCGSPSGDLPTLAPGEHGPLPRKRVELDPLPWLPGQAFRVSLQVRDCRAKGLVLDVLDVLVIPPATPDGVPTLQLADPGADG